MTLLALRRLSLHAAGTLVIAATALLAVGCGGDDDNSTAAAKRRPAALTTSAGSVTSHTCDKNADYVSTSKSTFKPNATGHYQVRVWYYDASGYAFYKKPWVDKGTATAYNTMSHTTSLTSAKTRRALVTWMDVNATDRYSQRWADCT